MNNVIIDCGTNLCQGLNMMIQRYDADKTWKIFSLEANPYTFSHAKKIVSTVYPDWPITLINKAVWVKDCKRKMTIECVDERTIRHCVSQVSNTSDMINLEEENLFWVGGASNIMEDNFNTSHPLVAKVKEQAVEVECINFAKFLEEETQSNDNVFIKFDIEGAEYSVINKLLKSESINRVKEITVEWHNHMLKQPYDESFLISELTNKNIKIHGHG